MMSFPHGDEFLENGSFPFGDECLKNSELSTWYDDDDDPHDEQYVKNSELSTRWWMTENWWVIYMVLNSWKMVTYSCGN